MNEVFFLELLNMGYMQTLKKPYQTVDSKFHWNFQNKFCMNVFEKQVSMELLALKSLWKFLGSSIINLNAKFCGVGEQISGKRLINAIFSQKCLTDLLQR